MCRGYGLGLGPSGGDGSRVPMGNTRRVCLGLSLPPRRNVQSLMCTGNQSWTGWSVDPAWGGGVSGVCSCLKPGDLRERERGRGRILDPHIPWALELSHGLHWCLR